jgi:hypothetical protein
MTTGEKLYHNLTVSTARVGWAEHSEAYVSARSAGSCVGTALCAFAHPALAKQVARIEQREIRVSLAARRSFLDSALRPRPSLRAATRAAHIGETTNAANRELSKQAHVSPD